jgi:N-glycosylase/DNA lyase
MNSMRTTEWRKLPITLTELCLATTLRGGQSFRWQKSDDDTWACSLRGRILQLAQDSTHLRYRALYPAAFEAPATPPSSMVAPEDEDDTKELVQHYLNLEPNLDKLYQQWSSADKNFNKKAPKFTGVRILRQDAWETLVGFICSSNNNIIRISQMVDKLCLHYGRRLGNLDGKIYHDFPTPAALTGKNVESHLRELGFGYRAKYIAQTAKMIAIDREAGWLDSIRNPERPAFGNKPYPAGEMKPEGREGYHAAHEKLLDLQGVGPKVADCVCLMGLGWGEAVPVDTHVWQIAQRDYKFGKGKHNNLTKVTYDAVANHFRMLWGKEAGWAHSVLFTADLRAFSQQLAAKAEVKSEVKADLYTPDASLIKKETIKVFRVKRELDDDENEKKIFQIEETSSTTAMTAGERVKRRRRG